MIPGVVLIRDIIEEIVEDDLERQNVTGETPQDHTKPDLHCCASMIIRNY